MKSASSPPASSPVNPRWDAAGYAAHSEVQSVWAHDLLTGLNLQGDEHVLDVGCGDGKITAEIARAVPNGKVLGTDISPEMIAFAQGRFDRSVYPNLFFSVLDARCLSRDALPLDRSMDLVFSNAALHWVDDHERFLEGAASILRPGGRLLISCGGQGNARDVFLALRPEMRLKRWRSFFRKMPTPYFFHTPSEYHDWLPRHGFKVRSVRLTPKDAVYQGTEGFAAWLRTTWIPYVQRVPQEMREDWIAAVTQRFIQAHPPDTHGRLHVRMVRLEIDASRV